MTTSDEPTAQRPSADGDELDPDLPGEPTPIDNETETETVRAEALPAPAPVQRLLAWCAQRRVAVTALALVVASAVAAGAVYLWLYRPDQLTGAQAQQQVVAAAKEGIEAALSYSPENLDQDLANAKSHLTGQFLDYYADFTAKVVTPAATQKGVKTEAHVARAAASQPKMPSPHSATLR